MEYQRVRRSGAAIPGPRQELPGPPQAVLTWIAPVAALLAALLAAGAVRAQGTAIPPPSTTAPTLPPGSGSDSAGPVPAPNSRPSAPDTPGGTARNGVAVPRANPDPGIVAPTPPTPSGMPVIRPPGTPGGDAGVVPK